MEPGLEVVRRYMCELPFMFSNACHICTVEVDPVTGAVPLLRYVVSEDCGVMINPASSTARSPAVWCRASAAPCRGLRLRRHGNPLTTTFLDYLLPTAADVP